MVWLVTSVKAAGVSLDADWAVRASNGRSAGMADVFTIDFFIVGVRRVLKHEDAERKLGMLDESQFLVGNEPIRSQLFLGVGIRLKALGCVGWIGSRWLGNWVRSRYTESASKR